MLYIEPDCVSDETVKSKIEITFRHRSGEGKLHVKSDRNDTFSKIRNLFRDCSSLSVKSKEESSAEQRERQEDVTRAQRRGFFFFFAAS